MSPNHLMPFPSRLYRYPQQLSVTGRWVFTCKMVSKLNVSPFHRVNSPLEAPVTRRRPSGVHWRKQMNSLNIQNAPPTPVETLTLITNTGHFTLLVEVRTNFVVTAFIGLFNMPRGGTSWRDQQGSSGAHQDFTEAQSANKLILFREAKLAHSHHCNILHQAGWLWSLGDLAATNGSGVDRETSTLVLPNWSQWRTGDCCYDSVVVTPKCLMTEGL